MNEMIRRAAHRLRLGYLEGAFDLFHQGHLTLLTQARQSCDSLVIGVLTDSRVLEDTGVAPVVPLSERLEIVRSIRAVDDAVAVETRGELDAWQRHGFDVYFRSDAHRGTRRGAQLEQQLADLGVDVVYYAHSVPRARTELRRPVAAH